MSWWQWLLVALGLAFYAVVGILYITPGNPQQATDSSSRTRRQG